MEKESKIAIIIGLVFIVTFFIITRKYMYKTGKSENFTNTLYNNTNNITVQNISILENQIEFQENILEENIAQNITQNIIEEDVINEEENDKENLNNNNENNKSQTTKGLEETTSVEEEKKINKKEEALKLVKEEWGEDDTVYYTIDNESGNIFSISVRSKSTTAVLQEYEIDVSKGTVTLK